MPDATSQVRRKLFWMVAIALALRLAVMAYTYPLQLAPARGHWAFGYETGRIARSIATGHGFGSPLFGDTGPTAWMTPVYPYIVAGFFKVFGIFTKASALAILSLNAITSALTCLPIFFFTRKCFGEAAAAWAGWIWAVFPYAVYWPVERIWDTWLATLLLAVLFWMALRLAESGRVRDWIAFGVLSGIAALTDPIVLSALPLLALWAVWRLHKARVRWLLPAIGAMAAVILVISPWFIRNERAFHRFIPFRDNFPLALRVGNIGDPVHSLTLQAGPWLNDGEWREFQTYGEIPYMDQKKREARAYITAHRSEYVVNCVRRVVIFWTGFWYLAPRWRSDFAPAPSEVFLLGGLTILALLGLRDAFRRHAAAVPYAIVFLVLPVAYYVTSIEPWYRFPMDPLIISLAAVAISSRLSASRASQSVDDLAAPSFPEHGEHRPIAVVEQ